jgi:hypothetical protein
MSWVLLLEPVPDIKDTFKRIGMGIVLSNSWTEDWRVEKVINII